MTRRRSNSRMPTAIMVLTPDGKDRAVLLRRGVSAERSAAGTGREAGQGRIGNLVDALLLYCYHYDPRAGKYSATILRVMRLWWRW